MNKNVFGIITEEDILLRKIDSPTSIIQEDPIIGKNNLT